MRVVLAILLLILISVSPAKPANASDVVACQKAEVADIIVVAIKVSDGYKYACGNGANAQGTPNHGISKEDIDYFVHDYTDTPERRMQEFGTRETPKAIYYGIHRVEEPLGHTLKMYKY